MSLSSGCAQPLQDGRYFDARVLRSQEDNNDPHMYVFAASKCIYNYAIVSSINAREPIHAEGKAE
jgi:hypothetical protein